MVTEDHNAVNHLVEIECSVIVTCILCTSCSFITCVSTSCSRALFNSIVDGFVFGFSQSFIFFLYAVVFRFGAFQIIQDPGSVAHADFQSIFRVFMAIVFGSVSIGQAGAFAPDYAKAKISVNRIFALLDRKPLMDSYSEDGDKLVSY